MKPECPLATAITLSGIVPTFRVSLYCAEYTQYAHVGISLTFLSGQKRSLCMEVAFTCKVCGQFHLEPWKSMAGLGDNH